MGDFIFKVACLEFGYLKSITNYYIYIYIYTHIHIHTYVCYIKHTYIDMCVWHVWYNVYTYVFNFEIIRII